LLRQADDPRHARQKAWAKHEIRAPKQIKPLAWRIADENARIKQKAANLTVAA
jgi:hypothetical protein